MKMKSKGMDRREFLSQSSKFAAATFFGMVNMSSETQAASSRKLRLALAGTGWRGTSTWGKELIHPFSEYVEMVALCDINPKRLNVAKEIIGTNAPGYLAIDFNLMVITNRFVSRIVGAAPLLKSVIFIGILTKMRNS